MGLQDQSLECCAWLHAVGARERRFAWSLHLEWQSLSTQKQCSQFARDSDSSVLLPGRAPRVQTLLWQIFFQKQKFSNKLDCGEVRSTVRFSIVPYCLWSLYSTSLASTHCGSAAIDGWIWNDLVVYVFRLGRINDLLRVVVFAQANLVYGACEVPSMEGFDQERDDMRRTKLSSWFHTALGLYSLLRWPLTPESSDPYLLP